MQAIGGAPDALRMQRVVSFYEKLPRGVAPESKAKGILGRYQAKHFGKKTSVQRTILPFFEIYSFLTFSNANTTALIHIIVFLVGVGYAQNYYFHLRACLPYFAICGDLSS